MTARLILAPEVEQDVGQAYAWYETQRAGLGEEYLNCVDACIQGLQRSPEIHAKVHNDYRRAMVRRFPYVIFYEYEKDTVIIYCVFHASRDPDKWKKRLA